MDIKFFILVVFLSGPTSKIYVESFNLSDYRLPTWAYPNHYYLTIDFREPDADTFRAYTWIDINVTEENHYELVLNVDPLYIDVNTSVITVDTAEFICDQHDYSNETQILLLTCMYDMFGNYTQFAQFEMHYTAKYSDTSDGMYKHLYSVNGVEKSVIFTQFEPAKFRRVFPSFDEPGFKAPISLSIDHYDNLTVVSNMPALEDINNALGFKETSFNVTPSMSSYLLAIIAGSYDDWDNYFIPFYDNYRIFRQKIYEDYVSITRDNAPKLMDNMGAYTGIEYKDLGVPTMTFAALPGMGGGMENWGLITFGEGYLIDEGNRTTSKNLISQLTVIAHEISHQWFGDYVTCAWWSEIWLNEGFASYFEWYLANSLSTDDNNYELDKLFVINELQPGLLGDGPDAIPLSNNDSNVNTPTEMHNSFTTAIAYNKGGSIVRMLRYALGEDTFKKGIQEYLQANALSNARASDLIQHLQAALPNDTDIDLATYLDSWIHQPGYPIVRTSFGDTGQDYYLVSIDIYKFSPTLNKTDYQPEESIWWTPISYITSDNPDPGNASYFWINPGRTFAMYVPKDDYSWGLINADGTGFYRVDYDQQTMERIINVLNNETSYSDVATLNRAQLLDDVFNIAKYYSIRDLDDFVRPYEKAFRVAQYLKYEQEYVPWYTFLKEVQYLLDEIPDKNTTDTLKADVLALIEPQLVIPDPSDTNVYTHSEILKRNLLLEWASKLEYSASLAYVNTQYANFLKDAKSVDSNYRNVIICYGLKHSNDTMKDYATLLKLYSDSILPHEKNDIAIGLSCMMDSDLLKSYLESTLTSVPLIDKGSWAKIFKNVYWGSAEGLDAALDFVVTHIDRIEQKWKGAMDVETILTSIASKIVKAEQIEKLQNILTANSLDPDAIKAVNDAIKKAETNVVWANEFGPEITSILVYNGSSVPTTTSATTPTTTTTTTTEIPQTTTPGQGVNHLSNMFSVFMTLIFLFLLK